MRWISSFSAQRQALSTFAGVGFAKNMEGNLEIMSGLQRIRSQLKGSLQGMPMLLGPSRKGFLGKLTGSIAPCICSLAACYASSICSAGLCCQMCSVVHAVLELLHVDTTDDRNPFQCHTAATM